MRAARWESFSTSRPGPRRRSRLGPTLNLTPLEPRASAAPAAASQPPSPSMGTQLPIDALEEFLSKVRSWAASEPEIEAVALVGSYARGEATPESDIDLVLLSRAPGFFI